MKQKYGIILLIMALLSPLGLIAEGTAWGEWGLEDLTELVGYVPQGLEQAQEWWAAIFPDYTIPILGEGKVVESISYVCSALIGSGLIYGLIVLYGKMIIKKASTM
ncbi:PDGLE domain-containing protein [Pelosinus sp. IPA-1]|uniref:PDGLE domain-containing protein n=1 Tax=Pelosinus sp. IPA-1 TaxID=3029569 RepID=UPI0024361CA2|nr:PDGLE domain-containing protein [Pelosinus sp. IPA-1]GMB00173.1 hypothetical protein PIPA1_29720 [Pelosinus sp. IPA-1]